MTKFAQPRAGQRETDIRQAFARAISKTPEHTRVTGQVFRTLKTPAGIVSI